MRRTDHILALTSTLLTCAEEQVPAVLQEIIGSYALDEPRKVNAVSLGAVDETIQGHDLSFKKWITALRNEGPLQTHADFQSADRALPAHIAAAFAGSADLVLTVTSSINRRSFILLPFFSSSYNLAVADFIGLLDAQPDRDSMWNRAYQLIIESNRLNNRVIFEIAEMPAWLTSPEGQQVYQSLLGNLVEELQIESTVHGQAFIIPAGLTAQFIKYRSPFRNDPADDREYVYLYPERDVDAAEVLILVKAQSFAAATWERVNVTISEYADPTMTIVPPEQWEQRIKDMSAEELQRFVNPICRSICTLCEDAHLKPVIPAELAQAFGPDELDQRRAAARSRSNDRWTLQRNSMPWEYYQFVQVQPMEEGQLLAAKSRSDEDLTGESDQTRVELVHALQQALQFAAKINSTFEESFRLSLYVLADDGPAQAYNADRVDSPGSKLSKLGFSEYAVEALRRSSWISSTFSAMGWESRPVKDLIAISLADVFGGMGSWNDQYVAEEQERYALVSAVLFDALRKHFAALISQSFKVKKK